MKYDMSFALASAAATCSSFELESNLNFSNWEKIGSNHTLLEIDAWRKMGAAAVPAYYERIAQYFTAIGMPDVACTLIGPRTKYPLFEEWKEIMSMTVSVRGAPLTVAREDYIKCLARAIHRLHGVVLDVESPLFLPGSGGGVYYECLVIGDSFSNLLVFNNKGNSKPFRNHSGLQALVQTRQLSDDIDYEILAEDVWRNILLLKNKFGMIRRK